MRKRTLFLVIIAAGVVGAAAFGWMTIRRGFSARDNPSAMEAYVARSVRSLAIPASGRDAKNPFTATPELLAETRAHFADHCATCHANNGSGDTEVGRNLYPKAPDMRQPQTQNMTDGEIYSPSTTAFVCRGCRPGEKPTRMMTAGNLSSSSATFRN
jgi:cytochrome c553